jgi:peroxisomal 2,4-dienoyl-CoA reductase
VIEIDLVGTFNLSKACFELLKASKGVIINISANLQMYGNRWTSHANSAKAAIDALTGICWSFSFFCFCVSLPDTAAVPE